MHSSKVSLSQALSNAALSEFNHAYSCEYSESACDKETLDLCIFFFYLNFNIFYKMLFSDGVGNDCLLSCCWDLNGGLSVHSVNYSRQSRAPWNSDPQADWWTFVRFLVVWTASIV